MCTTFYIIVIIIYKGESPVILIQLQAVVIGLFQRFLQKKGNLKLNLNLLKPPENFKQICPTW